MSPGKAFVHEIRSFWIHRVIACSEGSEGVDIPKEDGLVQPSAGHLFSSVVDPDKVLIAKVEVWTSKVPWDPTCLFPVPSIGEGLHVILVGAQRGHAEPLVGVPHFDGGVARRRYDVFSPTAKLDVVHPVGVMLHRLHIRIRVVSYVPYSYN